MLAYVILDESCLPANQQHIQFQIVVEELKDIWRNGYYNAIEQAIYEQPNNEGLSNIYCMSADVVRWLPMDELPSGAWLHLSNDAL